MITQHPQQSPLRDPDPFVLDLLTKVATAAIAGGIIKLGTRLWDARKKRHADVEIVSRTQLAVLRGRVDELDSLVDRASELVSPGARLRLGGQLLLSSSDLKEYERVRDGLFEQVRDIDRLAVSLSPAPEEITARKVNNRLPEGFRAQISFLEDRLRSARTAS